MRALTVVGPTLRVGTWRVGTLEDVVSLALADAACQKIKGNPRWWAVVQVFWYGHSA